jgi:hypothetical protein
MNKKLIETKIRDFSKKIKIIKYLGGKCKKCGNDNIFHLVCHHLENKEIPVSKLIRLSWSKIKEEIEKCELLCENCHQELHYIERGKTIKDDSRRKDKLIYLEYKGIKCERCGYDRCEASLSFHHKDPKLKSFDIGSLSERINSLSEVKDYIIKELDKCEVICRNCHLEEHKDIDFFNKYKEDIYYKVENLRKISRKVDRNKIKELYNKGLNNKQIAKELKCARNTISEITKYLK